MRKRVVTETITVDGVIDAAKGWFAPSGTEEVDVSDIVEAIRQQREAADALLVGRVTFEELRGFWPAQTDDTTGISDYLNTVQKYVVSSTSPACSSTRSSSGRVSACFRTATS
jgi:dihydrofolate reductase